MNGPLSRRSALRALAAAPIAAPAAAKAAISGALGGPVATKAIGEAVLAQKMASLATGGISVGPPGFVSGGFCNPTVARVYLALNKLGLLTPDARKAFEQDRGIGYHIPIDLVHMRSVSIAGARAIADQQRERAFISNLERVIAGEGLTKKIQEQLHKLFEEEQRNTDVNATLPAQGYYHG